MDEQNKHEWIENRVSELMGAENSDGTKAGDIAVLYEQATVDYFDAHSTPDPCDYCGRYCDSDCINDEQPDITPDDIENSIEEWDAQGCVRRYRPKSRPEDM